MGARGPTDFGDYQIAHLPPAAACAGAARWAAKYKEYALLRSVFCRTACQHAADKPAHRRAEHGSGSGERRTSDSLYDDQHIFWLSRGTRPKVTRARGRGTFPAGGMQGKSRQVAVGKSDPRSEARNIPFGKRIAGRRGRRPLQCAGTEPRRNERGRGRTSVRQTFPAII